MVSASSIAFLFSSIAATRADSETAGKKPQRTSEVTLS